MVCSDRCRTDGTPQGKASRLSKRRNLWEPETDGNIPRSRGKHRSVMPIPHTRGPFPDQWRRRKFRTVHTYMCIHAYHKTTYICVRSTWFSEEKESKMVRRSCSIESEHSPTETKLCRLFARRGMLAFSRRNNSLSFSSRSLSRARSLSHSLTPHTHRHRPPHKTHTDKSTHPHHGSGKA